jgi:hypothetical protein
MSLIKRAIVANRKKALPAGTSTVRIMFHEVERPAAVRFVFDLPVVPRVVCGCRFGLLSTHTLI